MEIPLLLLLSIPITTIAISSIRITLTPQTLPAQPREFLQHAFPGKVFASRAGPQRQRRRQGEEDIGEDKLQEEFKKKET